MVGAGKVAARKIRLLLKVKAEVTVIAPHTSEQVDAIRLTTKIKHMDRLFEPEDVIGYTLIIAATNDAEINRLIASCARQNNIAVNVVDRPHLGTFTIPAVVDRAPIIIAVSTGGASPVLARLLRTHIESLIPSAYGKLASLVRQFRQPVKKQFPLLDDRRRFWERALRGPIVEMVFSGRERDAKQALTDLLVAKEPTFCRGEVYLVGAGPGDPDLLTFRALRLMQQADVVLYDRLVPAPILDLTRHDAEKIYVGKEKSNHSMPQLKINELLASLAKRGKKVLRLKGGDPFIFGRGGEEINDLTTQGIPFQVVPGITAASGCASYAGIPLTHRDYAQSCVFVSGHIQKGLIDLNWELLVQPRQTVVIYMSLVGLPIICSKLIAHGARADTPIALIEQGTTRKQRVHTGSLTTLPEIVESNVVEAPTLVIVGEVVRLHERLSWFPPGLK